jgi:TolB-like protein
LGVREWLPTSGEPTNDGRRTIAFASFDNCSGDPAQVYFDRGFVEDVATELSWFGTLEVPHPSAVWTSHQKTFAQLLARPGTRCTACQM